MMRGDWRDEARPFEDLDKAAIERADFRRMPHAFDQCCREWHGECCMICHGLRNAALHVAFERAMDEEAEHSYLLTLPGADASAEPTDAPTAVNPAITDEPGGDDAARFGPED